MILDVKRRLDVPFAVREIQIQLRAGIECRPLGDLILQRFVNRSEEGIGAGFPVVVAVVAGDVAANVAFAIAAVLIDDDRGGKRIGAKREAGIAHGAGKAEEQVGRDGVLEIDLPAGFGTGGVLPLQQGLLREIVGNDVAQGIVGDGQAQPVVVGEVAFVSRGKSTGVTVVAEVAGDRRVEVTAGMQAECADGVALFFAGERNRSGAIQLIEAAAGSGEIAVPAEKRVFVGGEFDDSAEFAAVFGGIAGG